MMTVATNKWLKAVLVGATFLVVVALPGCSTFKSWVRQDKPAEMQVAPESETHETETAAVPDEPDLVFDSLAIEQPAPPVVNVFGEFDGIERKAPGSAANSGYQQHTFVDEGYDSDVSVDPAGKWIVFSSTRHAENTDIYLQKVDGMSVTQLTSDSADDAFPVFSTDGKQIAFCSTRSGNWDIYVMDSDGHNVVQVTRGPMQDIHPSFSPDGSQLAYCSLGTRSDQWELWTVDLMTNERKMIGTGLFPVWSPNKSKNQIAFQRARQRGSRWFSLWTLDLVDGEAHRTTEVAVSANAAIVSPSWSPDGGRLSFSTIVEPARTAGGKPQGQQDIWVVDADGGNRRRLTDGSGTNLEPYWAVDNRIYFISDRAGHESIWSVATGASNVSTANTDAAEVGH
jgi:Tol biopolymer transport system component